MSLESDIKSLVSTLDVAIYDITTVSENGETIYRVLITAKGGISMDKCVEVTKMISPLLDVTAPVKGDYRLEVSSPGIERKLKTAKHFEGSVGENVKISNLANEVFKGELLSFKSGVITVKTENGDDSVKLDEVYKASTYFEW